MSSISLLIELLTELSGRQKSFPDSVTIGHAIEELQQAEKRINELETEISFLKRMHSNE